MQNKEEVCSDGMCFVWHWPKEDQSGGGCDDPPNNLTILHLISSIGTDGNIYQEEDQIEYQIANKTSSIDYWCRVNHCNNQTTVNLIKKAVKDHYDMSPVYKALKVKIKEDLEEEEHTTTSEGETTMASEEETTMTSEEETTNITNSIITITSNTNTTEQRNSIATSFDIFIIMIIFNACLILFA
jgi:hypothetical protein